MFSSKTCLRVRSEYSTILLLYGGFLACDSHLSLHQAPRLFLQSPKVSFLCLEPPACLLIRADRVKQAAPAVVGVVWKRFHDQVQVNGVFVYHEHGRGFVEDLSVDV